jgi:hypothetical protein
LTKRDGITAAIGVALGLMAGYGFARLSGSGSLLDAPNASGPTLARYAGRKLTLSEAEAGLRVPGSQASASVVSTPEARRSYVEGLVRLDLLARLAEEKGYHRDPAFVRRVRQELAAIYLEKEFEEPTRKQAPTDPELAKYFEESKGKIQRPERLRIAVVVFRAEDDATRKAKRPVAQKVLGELRRRSGDYYAFGEIAAARSEEPRSAVTSGELPAMSREELEAGFGPTLAAKAFAMPRQSGALLDGVVEGGRGLFLVKFLGVEPAYEPKLEEVRDALRTQLATERRTKGLEAFLGDVWKKADVKIDEEALKQLKPPKAPPASAAAAK